MAPRVLLTFDSRGRTTLETPNIHPHGPFDLHRGGLLSYNRIVLCRPQLRSCRGSIRRFLMRLGVRLHVSKWHLESSPSEFRQRRNAPFYGLVSPTVERHRSQNWTALTRWGSRSMGPAGVSMRLHPNNFLGRTRSLRVCLSSRA